MYTVVVESCPTLECVRFLFRSIIKDVLETHADVNERSAMVRIQRGLTRNVLCEENTQHLNKVYLVMI